MRGTYKLKECEMNKWAIYEGDRMIFIGREDTANKIMDKLIEGSGFEGNTPDFFTKGWN